LGDKEKQGLIKMPDWAVDLLEVKPRVLTVPMHPGIQYHFARVGFPTFFLGNWDQFKYWRPKPQNVINLLPQYSAEQLKFGPKEYRKLLQQQILPRYPNEFHCAWLHFPWQMKLFRDDPHPPKIYFVAKEDELSDTEWSALLERSDFTVVSYYPNTTEWVAKRFGVHLPEIQLGLDPGHYFGWTGEKPMLLTVIHSWQQRGWHYHQYREATAGLPTYHVDHLDPGQPITTYEELLKLYRCARVYLHDGEREYTIALIEALMTGMPIVTLDLPGIARYVEHGVNGFVGRNVGEIRRYSQILLEDVSLAQTFGAASRRKALEHHHEAQWRARWRKIVQDLL
jgi:hypothetical protein